MRARREHPRRGVTAGCSSRRPRAAEAPTHLAVAFDNPSARSGTTSLLYRRLATLVEDAPLAVGLDDLRWHGIPRGPFEAWCEAVAQPGWAATLHGRGVRWVE